MRRALLLVLAPFLAPFFAVVSCGRPPPRRSDNEILFSIRQEANATSARWQFLTLANHGHITEHSDDEEEGAECYFEALDDRVGPVHVERGVATFRSARLPDEGLTIVANQEPPRIASIAWRTGDSLAFEASGFAIPPVPPIRLTAPPAELEVMAPLDGDLTVDADADLELLWQPPARRTDAKIVVTIDTESRDRAICFFASAPGHGSMPRSLLAVLRARSRSTRGTLEIGTHAQAALPGPGGWMLYVVANHVARSQPIMVN